MRPFLAVFLAVIGLMLIPQVATAGEYYCDAVAEQVMPEHFYGECPVEGSGGCIGPYTTWHHTFQCICGGYICYQPCMERTYWDYDLTYCECYPYAMKWQITDEKTCDICPGYYYPNYPWEG